MQMIGHTDRRKENDTMNARFMRCMNGETLEIHSGDTVVLAITEKPTDNEMHIFVEGEIKNEIAYEFEDELMASFTVRNVVKLDLSKVSYIASMAMRALLSVQQMIDENEDAALVITKISPEVKKEFEEHGFCDMLNIEE